MMSNRFAAGPSKSVSLEQRQLGSRPGAGSVVAAMISGAEARMSAARAMHSRGHFCKRPERLARRLHNNKRQQQQQQRLTMSQMERKISFRCKNILAARSVPLLFILICFLAIANTRCDQAGGTNVAEEATSEHTGGNSLNVAGAVDKLKPSDIANLSAKDLDALEQQANNLKQHKHSSTASKMDPLNILREIYLDSNSKVITMLMPESESVQKFHPNGRYGRRSVDNYAEPHVELGRLIYKSEQESQSQEAPLRANSAGDASTLRAILRGIGRGAANLDSGLSPVATAHSRGTPTKYRGASAASPAPVSMGAAQLDNYQLEMNKLLKCNYTGISNLYWCDTTSNN